MPDQIPDFEFYLSAAKNVEPMPVEEIRHRGNRRRTGRRTGIAVGAAALVAAAGIGVSQAAGILAGPDTEPVPAGPGPVTAAPTPTDAPSTPADPTPSQSTTPEPTSTAPPPKDNLPAELSPDLLPTGEEMGSAGEPSEVKAEYPSLSQEQTDICDPGTWGDPASVIRREYGAPGDHAAYQWATLLQYASVDDATAAYQEATAGYQNCGQRSGTDGVEDASWHDETNELPLDTSAIGRQPVNAMLGRFSAGMSGTEEGHFGQALIVQMGDRVLWISEDVVGMDYNCSNTVDADQEQCTVPKVAQEASERAGG